MNSYFGVREYQPIADGQQASFLVIEPGSLMNHNYNAIKATSSFLLVEVPDSSKID
jgi:hypothetical protein